MTLQVRPLQPFTLPIEQTCSYHIEQKSSGRYSHFPIDKWTPLNGFHQLMDPPKSEVTDELLVFKFSEAALQAFQELLKGEMEHVTPETLKKHSLQLIQSIPGLGMTSLKGCDLLVTPAGQVSTAFDYTSNGYLGLHIDTHDKTPNDQRHQSPFILSLNLGTAPRYFHFVNLTFEEIRQHLFDTAPSYSLENKSMHEVVHAFFIYHPNYPTYRLIIPPACGYLARTQNLIHDGGTNDLDEDDYCLLISGDFKIPNSNTSN